MNADKINFILSFTILFIGFVSTVTLSYILIKKRKKREIKLKFKKFTEYHLLSKKDLRAVPRVLIPESFDVILSLTETEYYGLRTFVIDMSLSAFATKPDFSLKKLPLNTHVKNVLIITPINSFVIKEMKTVRVDSHMEKKLIVFRIEQIVEDQFEELKRFMAYLDKFLKW